MCYVYLYKASILIKYECKVTMFSKRRGEVRRKKADLMLMCKVKIDFNFVTMVTSLNSSPCLFCNVVEESREHCFFRAQKSRLCGIKYGVCENFISYLLVFHLACVELED